MIDIILFLCTTLAGFFLGLYLQRRVTRLNDMWNDLSRYISTLKLNVTGRQCELANFNAEFVGSCSATFRECLVEKKFPKLNAQRKKRLEDFFAALDCTGSEQLLQNLDFYAKQFEPDLKESNEAVKKSSMYVKLGILLGAMVGILFL